MCFLVSHCKKGSGKRKYFTGIVKPNKRNTWSFTPNEAYRFYSFDLARYFADTAHKAVVLIENAEGQLFIIQNLRIYEKA